jgi:hypothetical protein
MTSRSDWRAVHGKGQPVQPELAAVHVSQIVRLGLTAVTNAGPSTRMRSVSTVRIEDARKRRLASPAPAIITVEDGRQGF